MSPFSPTAAFSSRKKRGTVSLVESDESRTILLDLSSSVLGNGDRGLLAIAVQTTATNQRLFCFYTVDPNQDEEDDEQEAFLRLRRYDLVDTPEGSLEVDKTQAFDLLGNDWSSGIPSCHFSHAAGSLVFLGDGSLVAGAGDGAHFEVVDSGGLDALCFGADKVDPGQDVGAFRACQTVSLAGKLLRLDPNTGNGLPDNPFYDGDPTSAASKIYCLGLRNPFRFSPIPSTGPREALAIADVGWRRWEELNLAFGGEHFGWPCFEGDESRDDYRGADPANFCDTADAAHVRPWLTWSHTDPGNAGFVAHSLSGTVVYDDVAYPPKYRDSLFFCDYTDGWIRFARLGSDLTLGTVHLFGTEFDAPISLACDPSTGDLIVLDLGSPSRIWRIRYVGGDSPPTLIASASPKTGEAPLSVSFQASSSFDPEGTPLTFEWNFGDGSTSSLPDPIHVYSVEQPLVARVTIRDGDERSTSQTFHITPGNAAPIITNIVSPTEGQVYQDQEVIVLAATASDLEDDLGGIPLNASWHIDLVTDHTVHRRLVGLGRIQPILHRRCARPWHVLPSPT